MVRGHGRLPAHCSTVDLEFAHDLRLDLIRISKCMMQDWRSVLMGASHTLRSQQPFSTSTVRLHSFGSWHNLTMYQARKNTPEHPQTRKSECFSRAHTRSVTRNREQRWQPLEDGRWGRVVGRVGAGRRYRSGSDRRGSAGHCMWVVVSPRAHHVRWAANRDLEFCWSSSSCYRKSDLQRPSKTARRMRPTWKAPRPVASASRASTRL
jgi:hypothetical protein